MRMYPNFGHEYELRQKIINLIGKNKGGIFIDVGANVGIYTIDLSKYFDLVYAVEPWYYEELEKNLKDYGVENVVVIPKAAWDFNGKVFIGINRYDNGVEVPKVGHYDKIVESVRLDDEIGKPFRLLKIDVEGEAIHVLRGMPNIISNSYGIAVIEVHNHNESHSTYLFMKEYGWKLKETWNERASGDKYHAHKVFEKW